MVEGFLFLFGREQKIVNRRLWMRKTRFTLFFCLLVMLVSSCAVEAASPARTSAWLLPATCIGVSQSGLSFSGCLSVCEGIHSTLIFRFLTLGLAKNISKGHGLNSVGILVGFFGS